MNILAAVITYKPDKELLMKNISSFAGSVSRIVIWDNTPEAEAGGIDFGGIPRDKIFLMGEGRNIGISKALNKVWKYASANGFDYILTMDQDSVWEGFDNFLDKISLRTDKEKCLFGPCVNGDKTNGDFSETVFLITSGMLVPVSVLDAVGGYREEFFTDAIDSDLVFHARMLGFLSYYVSGCSLVQRFGNPETSHAFGRNFRIYDYSPERLYGIFRNNIIVIRTYPDTVQLKKTFFDVWVRKRIIRILAGEKHKMAKISAIAKGIISGLFYKV
ncbi:MAG: hypothetical protein LKI42_05195 [Bacteroidales bacterium]|jgi:rhamnosyltransferase|nr:hypothetical protein [Bacteroidales bacterium]MCI1785044.1 hypothetical protein [Bacteroidales bacterium]